MSRREGRDSDSRRHRSSRFDREPSPKRYRRDGKPATERPASNLDLDGGDLSDRDQKHHHRLQDAVPLEAPLPPDHKADNRVVNRESDKKSDGSRVVNRESDKKTNGRHEGIKHSSDAVNLPRSRAHLQHDDRGNAGKVDRSFRHRNATDRGSWRQSKDRQSESETNRRSTRDSHQRDEKSHVRGEDNHAKRQDREADAKLPPVRKRPSFSEKKITVEAENVDKAANEPGKPGHTDLPALGKEETEGKGGHKPRDSDRPEKPNRETKWSAADEKRKFGARDSSIASGGRFRGQQDYQERHNGRQDYRPGGSRVDKWKHDLFDEANRSPPPKTEEDQIAKVEALLSS
ncbi:hypothetical protein RJ640_018642 [Escallonia rubra]|uniref:Btz domain-containing protein n=1 Tax=Escallonia rubra TaxID=112253 RepID=A0AA88UGN8_9ASTE|nr:hypothetical protein RJ640_018642 [Escallonia rubra]